MACASFGTWGVISNMFCELNQYDKCVSINVQVLYECTHRLRRRTVTFGSSVYAPLAEHKDLHSATECICVAHIILTINTDCLPKHHLRIDFSSLLFVRKELIFCM
jgi:hypothetical protein